MQDNRKYCTVCGGELTQKNEGDTLRDYCLSCGIFYYDNPLPVAANIVMKNREILLVKRKNPPFAGLWCLPMGFAESGESIEKAALRELNEETGIEGKTISLVNVESGHSDTYGDLLHLTFETEWLSGRLEAGDDAEDLSFFPFDNMPDMAFNANIHAIEKYIASKEDYWAIIDSFRQSIGDDRSVKVKESFVSDHLVELIEKNADVITSRWFDDVSKSKSTTTYSRFDSVAAFKRNRSVIRQLSKYIGGASSDKEIRKFYRKLGQDRRAEGFALSEVLSALSISRKHIWEFTLSQGLWDKPFDIYSILELERRIMLFFDKAAYHISVGYEEKG